MSLIELAEERGCEDVNVHRTFVGAILPKPDAD